MKLLLTGLPGTGKTTLLQSIIPILHDPFWVICSEIRDQHGQRVGFEAETSTQLKGLLAHKQNIVSEHTIGAYKVDLEAVDRILTEPIQQAREAGKFLLIDEIGRMQMLSPAFIKAIRDLFVSEADFLATIRYGDDWTSEFTGRPDTVTLVLTAKNREFAKAAIEAIMTSRATLQSLSGTQQETVQHMAKHYGQAGDFIQLKKLYKNAIKYLAEARIKQKDEKKWIVAGDHDQHIVAKQASSWSCDCDLFNGRAQFAGRAGECSHIQAAQLSLSGE